MKHRIYFRQIRRTVTRSLGRLLAIMGIVALGAGFLAGLSATEPTMKETANRYYADTDYMDVTLLCSLGIMEEDVESLREVKGVLSVWPTYRTDVMAQIADFDGESPARFSAMPVMEAEDPASMNRLTLISGRFPEAADECVVIRGKLEEAALKEGDKVRVPQADPPAEGEMLAIHEFTVVGVVDSPEYISIVLGTTTKGSGNLSYAFFVPEEAFDIDYYTVCYVRARGVEGISTYSEEYEQRMEKLTTKLESWAKERAEVREEAILEEIQEGIDSAYQELADKQEEAEKEIENAEESLREAEEAIREGSELLQEGQDTLEAGRSQLDAAWGQYYNGTGSLSDVKGELDHLQGIYQGILNRVESLKADTDAYLSAQREQEAADEAALEALRQEWAEAIIDLEAERSELDTLKAYLEEQAANLSKEELRAARREYEEKAAAFAVDYLEAATLEEKIKVSDAALTDLKENIAAYEASAAEQIAAAEAELNTAYWTLLGQEESYQQGLQEWEEKQQELEDAKAQVEEGWQEIASAREEMAEEIDKARAEIDDAAQNLLGEVPRSTWYVLPRTMNESYVSYQSDSDRMKTIASVFPWMFFVVAALVSLTTMTRMVEEERTQIGTYKALGFTKAEILNKYLLYAGAACLVGALVGIWIGFQILPRVICAAYGTMYLLPAPQIHYHVKWALISGIASLICTLGATVYACLNSLKSKPAVLMLPAAPKAGKKIWLEHIPFLWKPMSFTWKVTMRNLFRYQKRFWMTTIGIAGCTGLMLTGYGIKDSVMGIVDNQFHRVYAYDGSVGLSEGAVTNELLMTLDKAYGIEEYVLARSKMVDVRSDSRTVSCYLFVPEDTETIQEFIRFRVRTTGEEVSYEEGDVLLTEKGATLLKVSVGDSIWLPCADGSSASLKVTGICENYLRNYVYISPEIYEQVLGYDSVEYTEALFKLTDGATGEEVREEIGSTPGIQTIALMDDMIEPVRHMIQSLDMVIIVLIVSAAMLAFIVLYNLTNINIIERQREIATIKVLGFQPWETAAYIFRETMLLTLIGCGLGMLAGIVMHRFVITTVEVDYVMFGRTISGIHFMYAAGLTVLFSLLVDLVMYFHLKRINMVESLKSVE